MLIPTNFLLSQNMYTAYIHKNVNTDRDTHVYTQKKDSPSSVPLRLRRKGRTLLKEAATYSPALRCSTIGAGGLNFSVRDGKRWNPAAITA